MLAPKFAPQHTAYAAFGDEEEIPAAQQKQVTNDVVAGAVAYHVATKYDAYVAKHGKPDEKKCKECLKQWANEATKEEFEAKKLNWLDQKKVSAQAMALVEAECKKADAECKK